MVFSGVWQAFLGVPSHSSSHLGDVQESAAVEDCLYNSSNKAGVHAFCSIVPLNVGN